MIEITKVIEWDMGHRVPNHSNKCRSPHGHRYRLETTLQGPVSSVQGASCEGMVLDFGEVKALMMQAVHDTLDHGFMIYEHDSLLLDWLKHHPSEGWQILCVPFIPTAEHIVHWCYQQIAPLLPKGITISRCRLYETPNSWADFLP